MTQHSKTPWISRRRYIMDATNTQVAIADRGFDDIEACVENAAHIVHCVNQHEKLCEAIQVAIECLDSNRFSNVVESLRAVLTEAGRGM